MPESRFGGVGHVAASSDCEVVRLDLRRDPADRLGRHPQVERHEHDARPHRPEIRRGKVGRGR
jgi:hypothetical protein